MLGIIFGKTVGGGKGDEESAEAGLLRHQAVEKKKTYAPTPKEFGDDYGRTNDPDKPLKRLR